MADKIATREAYGKALAEFGAEYENLVVLDADLAAATKTGTFKKAFPLWKIRWAGTEKRPTKNSMKWQLRNSPHPFNKEVHHGR